VRGGGLAADDDGDGAVRLAVEGGIWTISVWAAVDLETGEYAVAVPPYSPLAAGTFPGQGLALGARGQLNRFQDRREAVEVFWARKGVGAWRLAALDGTGRDADGAEDGRVALQLDEAAPVGESPVAPKRLEGGDVVVAVDPRSFEFFAARVPGGGPEQ
jgi:hypothetical protein